MLLLRSLKIQDNQDNTEPHNETHIPQNHLRRKHIAKTINAKEIAVVTDSCWQWDAEKLKTRNIKCCCFRVGILQINPILILEAAPRTTNNNIIMLVTFRQIKINPSYMISHESGGKVGGNQNHNYTQISQNRQHWYNTLCQVVKKFISTTSLLEGFSLLPYTQKAQGNLFR